MNVLISLHHGYGLGDGVQMSAVLRHVVAAHPDWVVDYCAEEGRHQVGRGIVADTFSELPPPSSRRRYEAEFLIRLYDTWRGWTDRPNTHVSSCLHDVFGLTWCSEHGRYMINVTPKVMHSINPIVPVRAVALHYRGDSDTTNKNLRDEQAAEVCDSIKRLGCVPLLIDWRNQWSTRRIPQVCTVGGYPKSTVWGRCAEANAAVISLCRAFVGIDSGPAKCASATDAPVLVVWTKHHPANYHDPTPNTTHLVPVGYHDLSPVCGDPGVVKWFEQHYNFRLYASDPVESINQWLREVLR